MNSGKRTLLLVLCAAVVMPAQTTKRPLTHKDYDGWRTIASPQLSRNGQYLAYTFMPQEGDGDLIVRDLKSGKEWKTTVGALPPPPIPAPGELPAEGEGPQRRGVTLRFTSDNAWILANYYPAKAETDAARKARKRPDEMPKGGLLVWKLGDAEPARIAGVKSFQVPEKGGAWVAFHKEARPEERRTPEAAKPPAGDEDEDQRPGGAGARGAAGAGAAGASRSEFGTDLVLRELAKGEASDKTMASVLEYSFARDGKTLLYTVGSRKTEENGVYALSPGAEAAALALLSGKGKYSRLSWDREQTQMVFVSNKEDADSKTPKWKVYHWDRKSPAAAAVLAADTPGFPAGMVVSDRGAMAFSRDGKKLYAAAAKPGKAEPERPAEGAAPATPAAPTEDKVNLDLWHWRDDLIQPMQRIRAAQERNRTYRGVFHIAEKKYVQVADERTPNVFLTDDGTQAVGADDRPYRRMVDYDGNYSDFYWIDTATGQKKQVARQLRGGGFGGGMTWSPDGKRAYYFNDKHWWLVEPATGASRNVTASLGVAFHDEEDDTPDPAGSYGASGFTKDSQSILVNDRYDVWQVFADGRPAINLTQGAGRKNKITMRLQRVEPVDEDDDERGFDTTKPLHFRGVSEETRESGFYRIARAGAAPERLLWGAKSFQFGGRAREADVVMITASRFNEFPDIHLTDSNFKSPQKVTNGGAQLAQFTWGSAETIRFRNADGVALKGTLFKPENFDPAKKYPMIVYIYEKLSQGLHNFSNPGPGTSINTAYYVSNGYLVLQPDIVYTIGYPGQSALKCVLPAIDAVVDKGFVDEKAIGIQGHSWGGYQIAYMVGQTDRFRAAEAGAPVGNMTSAYSGIRWGSGLPRQFQYEQTQSRIGHPLYRNPQRFVENSPIFYAERVKTPLLILHNDQDDAVPWYQGIELYLALRRNNKETYLLNYNGEYHGLRRRHNQKDYTVRMQQFFDHHLKGAPKPEWMEKGVPFLDRDDEKEKFNKIYSDQR